MSSIPFDSNRLVVKLILCGEFGVGKSSLFRRFVHNSFLEHNDRNSTLGFDHFEKKITVDGRDVLLQLWDTGGLERVASVTTNYYKHADAALLCFAYDATDSFNALSNHLLEVLTSAHNAKVFLCGCKSDVKSMGMGPSDQDVATFIRENQINEQDNLFRAQYQTSSRTGIGVEHMFEDIARHMAHTMQPARPDPDYFQLRAQTRTDPTTSGCCQGGNHEEQ